MHLFALRICSRLLSIINMNDQDFRSPVSLGKLILHFSKLENNNLSNLARKDYQPFILSSVGHPAYAPFKLNVKAPVSFKKQKHF
jgi:hypothetical protein